MTAPDRIDDRPVDFAVHSMPQAHELEQQPARIRSGRIKMLLVLAVCAAPVIASYFTFYVVRPVGRTNFGVLVEPQRPLPELVAQDLDGKPVPMGSLRGQWLVMSVGNAACDARCESTLFLQRQLRAGLGKDKDRVDWVWLIDDDAPVPAAILPRLEGSTTLRIPAQSAAQWLGDGAAVSLHGAIFLVDPLGNFMMRFPAPDLETDSTQDAKLLHAKKVKRDVERLLRASASWDKTGR
jgi:hypothetical protein